MIIAFPIAMFYVSLNVLKLQPTDGTSIDLFRAEANRSWQARGISFAVFIGIVLFMWVPLWFFKISVRTPPRLVPPQSAHRRCAG